MREEVGGIDGFPKSANLCRVRASHFWRSNRDYQKGDKNAGAAPKWRSSKSSRTGFGGGRRSIEFKQRIVVRAWVHMKKTLTGFTKHRGFQTEEDEERGEIRSKNLGTPKFRRIAVKGLKKKGTVFLSFIKISPTE